jgi:glycosyltransferase involved in cell wall biosynthesis
VRIHGAEPDPLPLYAAFDLVVQASVREGLPNVLLEAGAAARPIVATAAGGSGEVVVDGVTGLLVPVEDRAALTSAMRAAMDDEGLRNRLGAAARDLVASQYGMDRFVAEWATFYERIAEAKGVRR